MCSPERARYRKRSGMLAAGGSYLDYPCENNVISEGTFAGADPFAGGPGPLATTLLGTGLGSMRWGSRGGSAAGLALR